MDKFLGDENFSIWLQKKMPKAIKRAIPYSYLTIQHTWYIISHVYYYYYY